jgi:periplasmic divalent cation tolerance protein
MASPDGSAATHLVAFTTAPSADEGRTIVRALVERRLVACGTVIPGGVSIYRWKGDVEEAREVVVILKTTAERWAALAAALPELHPYEVPELVVVPVVGGHSAYLQWLSEETAEPGPRKE